MLISWFWSLHIGYLCDFRKSTLRYLEVKGVAFATYFQMVQIKIIEKEIEKNTANVAKC